MMLLRSRHLELDKLRTMHPGFNVAWVMFFGTRPPGIHPAAVFFTEEERLSLANGMPPPDDLFEEAELGPTFRNV